MSTNASVVPSNLATIWSAEVDGLAMQGGAGGQAHWLQSVVSRPFERLVETRVRSPCGPNAKSGGL
jgi:hypothetical protein